MNRSILSGPKARHVKAWAGASPTSGGPGIRTNIFLQGLKDRNKTASSGKPHVPPFQGGGVCFGMSTWGFAPGYHISGFQPSAPCRIVAELDALQAEVDALKRLQAETAAELDALLPAILDKTFKGEL